MADEWRPRWPLPIGDRLRLWYLRVRHRGRDFSGLRALRRAGRITPRDMVLLSHERLWAIATGEIDPASASVAELRYAHEALRRSDMAEAGGSEAIARELAARGEAGTIGEG